MRMQSLMRLSQGSACTYYHAAHLQKVCPPQTASRSAARRLVFVAASSDSQHTSAANVNANANSTGVSTTPGRRRRFPLKQTAAEPSSSSSSSAKPASRNTSRVIAAFAQDQWAATPPGTQLVSQQVTASVRGGKLRVPCGIAADGATPKQRRRPGTPLRLDSFEQNDRGVYYKHIETEFVVEKSDWDPNEPNSTTTYYGGPAMLTWKLTDRSHFNVRDMRYKPPAVKKLLSKHSNVYAFAVEKLPGDRYRWLMKQLPEGERPAASCNRTHKA